MDNVWKRTSNIPYTHREEIRPLNVDAWLLMRSTVHLARVYIDLDGAWTSPDTRTRAASRARHRTMLEIRATPLFSAFFFSILNPESSARPCVGYLLLYSCYLNTFHDLLLSSSPRRSLRFSLFSPFTWTTFFACTFLPTFCAAISSLIRSPRYFIFIYLCVSAFTFDVLASFARENFDNLRARTNFIVCENKRSKPTCTTQ